MRIGEVARRAGISTRMLRHYDALGVVSPTGRTASGYREYTASDLRRLFDVESLRSLGLTLEEVRRALDDPGWSSSLVLDALIEATRARIAREELLLARLLEVRATGTETWTGVAEAVALLRDVRAADPSTRQRAALASERIAPGVLVEALIDEADANAAGALRWALRRSGDEAGEALARGLSSADPRGRRRVVEALTGQPGAAATAALVAALEDEIPDVRRAAARGLARRGRSEGEQELVAMIVDGDHDVEAAELLGALVRNEDDATRLVAVLDARLRAPGMPPPARSRITQALAELPAFATADVLARLRGDEDPSVARIAVYLSPPTSTPQPAEPARGPAQLGPRPAPLPE